MSSDSTNGNPSVAIKQLHEFGLSNFVSRPFVGLGRLGTRTAIDVSQESTVPRTRVYDVIHELHDRGIVEFLQRSPKQFWAIFPEAASRTLERDFNRHTEIQRSAPVNSIPSNALGTARWLAGQRRHRG